MSGRVDFKLNRRGGADILRRNGRLQNLEYSIMNSLVATVEAQFFQEFGLIGNFKVDGFVTDRSTVKIAAADAITNKTLQKNPAWLNQFLSTIKM